MLFIIRIFTAAAIALPITIALFWWDITSHLREVGDDLIVEVLASHHLNAPPPEGSDLNQQVLDELSDRRTQEVYDYGWVQLYDGMIFCYLLPGPFLGLLLAFTGPFPWCHPPQRDHHRISGVI